MMIHRSPISHVLVWIELETYSDGGFWTVIKDNGTGVRISQYYAIDDLNGTRDRTYLPRFIAPVRYE